MMHIGIQTWGSDGDVLPYVSLARGLILAGHRCTLAITSGDNKDYSHLVNGTSLRIVQTPSPMGNDPTLLDFAGQVIITKRDPFKQLEITLDTVSSLCLTDMYRASCDLCRSCDLVIAHSLCYSLRWVACRAHVAFINISLCPVATRSATPGETAPPYSWWRLPAAVQNKYERQMEQLWQTEGLDLPGSGGARDRDCRVLHLIGVSRALYQPLKDDAIQGCLCGFLSAPDGGHQWQSPPELEAFLAVDPPPVYVTFGSLMARSAALRMPVIQTLREAVRLAGCRAIIQVPPEDARRLPSDQNLLFCPPVSHRRVFPYCQAVVHHGGAGTTHASLQAGCPSVVVPHAYDQFFWGDLLARMNVAPPPLPLLDVTAVVLAERISRVRDSPQMKQAARRVGEIVKGEDGVAEAVRVIHAWYGGKTVV